MVLTNVSNLFKKYNNEYNLLIKIHYNTIIKNCINVSLIFLGETLTASQDKSFIFCQVKLTRNGKTQMTSASFPQVGHFQR